MTGDASPGDSGGRPPRAQVARSRRMGRDVSDGSCAASVRVKRAYLPYEPADGRRVLVDRLWPRGLSKADLHDAIWLPDVAPSTELRRWFAHRPERWTQFRARYLAELDRNPALETLRAVAAAGPVTLIYGARDEAHNQALVLAERLRGGAKAGGEDRSPRTARPQPDQPGAHPAGPRQGGA